MPRQSDTLRRPLVDERTLQNRGVCLQAFPSPPPPLPAPFHFFACPNLRAAKKRKRHLRVRKTLRTYPMETLATQASSRSNWNLEMLFLWREENRVTQRKPWAKN